ncbi:MAG: prolipoprotein diacylglyceryl transferase [Chlorobi bacterium]|nr:prolipoprotein diacylglyceryl transferase [Chlorobiota bacterium]
MLAFINWNVNPDIFHLGPLTIRWYGLLFALSFYLGYIIFKKIYNLENIHLDWLEKLTVYMFLGTVIGARLGHVFFYEPKYFLQNPMEILKIWHGGLASHGAALGILLALYLYARKIKKPYLWILDRIVIVVALSGFFIRTGNLMNSEIYGHITHVPWAFKFMREYPQGFPVSKMDPRHPTQIYEALVYLLIFVGLYFFYLKTKVSEYNGVLFSLFLIDVFAARFIIEFFKENQVAFEQGMKLNMGQWLSIPFVLIGLFLFIRILIKNKFQDIFEIKK